MFKPRKSLSKISPQLLQLLISVESGSGELGLFGALLFNIGIDIMDNYLSSKIPNREIDRIEKVFSKTFSKIAERINNGEDLRQDNFIKRDDTLKPEADILLEAILNNARNDVSEKKMELLANFYTNVVFINGISLETSIGTLSLVDKLNYRQFTLLAIIVVNNPNGKPDNYYGLSMNQGKKIDQSLEQYTIVNEIFELAKLNFVLMRYSEIQTIRITDLSQIEARILFATDIGNKFYELFSLDKIDRKELSNTIQLLKQ